MPRSVLLSLLLFFITSTVNSIDEKYKDKIVFENPEVYRVLTLLEPTKLLKNDAYIKEFAEDGGRENSDCIKDLRKMQEALTNNFTQQFMWTYKMLDASSKVPSGLLDGNLIDLGMYDECIAIRGDFDIRGHHCMYKFKMSQISVSVPVSAKLSICLPSSCSANDTFEFLNATINWISESYDLNVGLDSVTCSPLDRKIWDIEFTICFAILVIFIAFLVICTMCEIISERYDEYRKSKMMTTLVQFSFKKNTASIFNMEFKKGNLPVIHGLRFISMAWIVLGHEGMYMLRFPLVNKLRAIDQWLFQWNSLYIYTAQYAVDTFLVISGFLLSFLFLKQMSKQKPFNLPLYYLHRFIRLTPAVIALLICYIVFVPKMGSGPLWHHTIYKDTEICRKKWWSTLLYVQNFVHQNECLGHLWYLAVDMQLFWISPIILYPLYKKPKMGLIMLTAFFLASVITPAVIIVVNEYNVASYLRVDRRPGSSVYSESLIFQYVINIVWLLVLGGFAFCILFTKYFTEPDYTLNLPLEAFFIAASRPIWSFGVCWIIYTSIHNCGGVITKFLSCRIFLPLSRLSYCIYLLHMITESMQSSSFRTIKYFSDYYVWYYWIGDFAISIVVAILFTLLFESPILVLEKMIFNRNNSLSESRKEPAISSNDQNIILKK